MKTKILTILQNSTEYVSGESLCQNLGVSRTAVWKVMNQLKEDGYIIEAIRNKGYKLVFDPDILGSSQIKSRLESKWIGKEVHFFQETGSTNGDVKKMAEAGSCHGMVVIADMQKDGRGRRGRNWYSPSGKNLYFSLLLRPEFSPNNASSLTLVMALCVARAIEKLTTKKPGIKWPNDIILNGKKICGILTEMNAEVDFIHHVVIGVGININQEEFPEELEYGSSLLRECGQTISRTALLVDILQEFETAYEKYCQSEDMSNLIEEYNRLLVNKDQQVKVLDPKGEFTGIARGINEKGELLVDVGDGNQVAVYAGEVSVRGIYGYC